MQSCGDLESGLELMRVQSCLPGDRRQHLVKVGRTLPADPKPSGVLRRFGFRADYHQKSSGSPAYRIARYLPFTTGAFGSLAPVRYAASNGCNPSEAVGPSASANDN